MSKPIAFARNVLPSVLLDRDDASEGMSLGQLATQNKAQAALLRERARESIKGQGEFTRNDSRPAQVAFGLFTYLVSFADSAQATVYSGAAKLFGDE